MTDAELEAIWSEGMAMPVFAMSPAWKLVVAEARRARESERRLLAMLRDMVDLFPGHESAKRLSEKFLGGQSPQGLTIDRAIALLAAAAEGQEMETK